nr:MAG TPA: hypothetical protein [Caudoviricetes sp.]
MSQIIYVTPNFIQELEDEVLLSTPYGVKVNVKDDKTYKKYLIEDEEVIQRIEGYWKQFVPAQITVRQLKLQLLKLNLLDKADALVKADKEAQIEFEYAKDIEMNSPLLQKMAHALGLDDDGVLKFFDEASKL